MAKSLKNVRAALSPERRAHIDAEVREELSRIALAEIRAAAGATQAEMAARLAVSQAFISKIESRGDMMLSTMTKYIEAAGGRVEIVVHLPGTKTSFSSFSDLMGQQLSVYPLPKPSVERQLACHENGEVTHYDVRLDSSRARPAAFRKLKPAPVHAADDFSGEMRENFAALG